MKKLLCAALVFTALSGCSYAGIASAGGDRVVITRNDHFLFGLLRHVYVCKATDAGVTNCSEQEVP